ncbi:1,2-phenylacetyl-CoA epoxidase subunit PaaD [Aurantimonas sp. VKM B-3413]|uniref:1,2-phenylacetyl-CoA epoxidase subunit PaaD n=1 Tax=Aurantimonas sp. VKM B-3413 TaxID=2779401 RepID=UPI001E5BFF3B|nr:1,2-phenylacetyl-CoA epoxidase subunit PaaD [Aurantimonas sp. VKM B-3413]MCB8836382.1 phenylacetate-CoA oxygenase subunit PaaJ [Aurantimonas sp. VKM B-3413]
MQPSLETVRDWLGEIPDPEIPAISLVDLGIVRDVAYEDETLVVTVTPTYSGCPATLVIALDIETELTRRGAGKVKVRQQLSPAWTTDWISEAGREKLHAYGIAPPAVAAASCAGMLSAQTAACPHCGSQNTEVISARGSTPCKAQFRCRECLEPFDYFKAI